MSLASFGRLAKFAPSDRLTHEADFLQGSYI